MESVVPDAVDLDVPIVAPRPTSAHQARQLRTVKTLHTLAWAFFAGSIIGLPICGWVRRYDVAMVLAGIVSLEVVILAVNSWRCPLTAVASRFTPDRRANFDIYLPEGLARHNKSIFGTLVVVGVLFTLARWWGWLG